MASNIKELYWEQIIELIKETPNNSELGDKVRKLYWKMPDYLKGSKKF